MLLVRVVVGRGVMKIVHLVARDATLLVHADPHEAAHQFAVIDLSEESLLTEDLIAHVLKVEDSRDVTHVRRVLLSKVIVADHRAVIHDHQEDSKVTAKEEIRAQLVHVDSKVVNDLSVKVEVQEADRALMPHAENNNQLL